MNTQRKFLAWAAALAIVASAAPVRAFNQDHYFLYKSVGGHNYANGIGIGPDDKIYVADYNNSRLVIYDKDMNFLSQVTGIRPHDVTVSEDGIVYVADPVSNKVRKYDGGGNSLGDLNSGFAAHYVRIHPGNGNIYVKDNGGSYKVFKPDGTLVKSFGLPDGALFTVLRDGKLHLVSGKLYNDLGIQEKSGLPNGPYSIVNAGGYFYTGNNYYGGYIQIWDADYRNFYTMGGAYQSLPNYWARMGVNHQGDIIGSDQGANLYFFRRCEGNSMGPENRNAAPTSEITSLQQRANSTLLDIEYKVTDLDDPTVHVAAAAFKSNTNNLDNMVLMNTLVEGTAANVGPNQPVGQIRKLTWDAGADWGVDFGDIAVHFFVRDSRQLLMGLHFLDLPAEGANPAITLTRSPVHQGWFMEPLMWLAASKNPSVTFSAGRIHGVGGSFEGQMLASGTTVTQKGREFVESLMGVREATAAEVQAAREAATPGIVNQWDVAADTQKIDRAYPQKVNEYGFDTGSGYDSTWFWLVKVN